MYVRDISRKMDYTEPWRNDVGIKIVATLERAGAGIVNSQITRGMLFDRSWLISNIGIISKLQSQLLVIMAQQRKRRNG
jgi:hypothetical protein